MAVIDMFDRLKSGESINVVVPETGKTFTVEPAYSKYLPTSPIGYSIVVDGAIVPGHRGTLMDRETITAWAMDLDEVVEEDEAWEEELNAYYFSSRGV